MLKRVIINLKTWKMQTLSSERYTCMNFHFLNMLIYLCLYTEFFSILTSKIFPNFLFTPKILTLSYLHLKLYKLKQKTPTLVKTWIVRYGICLVYISRISTDKQNEQLEGFSAPTYMIWGVNMGIRRFKGWIKS